MIPLPRRLYALAAITLAAVIFVALNIAADSLLTSDRLDLTENGVYTLSDGTKHIIANLQEPVTLKFYYSKKVGAGYAQINAYAKRVRDLLEEYAARSDGKIILQEIDPQPFTPEEDQAGADGLSAAPTQSGEEVFFGLVGTNTIDGKEVIPFFSEEREGNLEYDVSSLIYRLATPKKPVLGIISGLPLDTGAGGMQAAMQGQARPFMIYQELAATYATKMLDQNFSAIPSDVDVLMIVDPGAMAPAQLYAIDQFVLKGGRALIFVDPMSELATAGQGMGGESASPASSDLPSLFRAWGIGYDASKVLGDRQLAQSVQLSADPRNPVAAYPVWLAIDAKHVSSRDAVTANIQSLNLASVGALSPLKNATTTFTPLVWSSKQASLLDVDEVRGAQHPEDLINDIVPAGRNYAIAARVSGPAKTSFPTGAPLSPADAAKTGPQVTSSKAINVIVMADSDIFDDRFWVRVENLYGKKLAAPFADNLGFVQGAVENSDGLERSHLAAHPRHQQPALRRRAASAGCSPGAIPAAGRPAEAEAERHRRPASRPAAGRLGDRRGQYADIADAGTAGQNRKLQARTRPDPQRPARRAAQSAQGYRRTRLLPRLREHRADAAPRRHRRNRPRRAAPPAPRPRHRDVRGRR